VSIPTDSIEATRKRSMFPPMGPVMFETMIQPPKQVSGRTALRENFGRQRKLGITWRHNCRYAHALAIRISTKTSTMVGTVT
jgi:hypothetical protein